MKKILFTLLVGTALVSQSCINDNEDVVQVPKIEGAITDPLVGGGAQPNQVWIDLSDLDAQNKPKQTLNKRTDWDLAFYSGDEFKVMINSTILMAAAKIPNVTDFATVNESTVGGLKDLVQVANFNPGNTIYIDDVKGDFPTGYTAIGEIVANASDNGIYLLNMGRKLFEGNVPVGSVATGGDERGWKKIQITRAGEGYKIKYANLDNSDLQELTITKNKAYNYNFVSLESNKEVFIQPEKNKWDLCFTVFTNIITGAGSYVYADFVTHNNLGGVGVYEVKATASQTGLEAYNQFKASDVDASKFIYNDQRIIGGNWRNPVGANGLEVYGDRFYVLKDANGYYFKLKFTRITHYQTGERGFPQFEYKPL